MWRIWPPVSIGAAMSEQPPLLLWTTIPLAPMLFSQSKSSNISATVSLIIPMQTYKTKYCKIINRPLMITPLLNFISLIWLEAKEPKKLGLLEQPWRKGSILTRVSLFLAMWFLHWVKKARKASMFHIGILNSQEFFRTP